MNVLRKIIGLLIIVFIGLPILFGVIWAVGLTRAAVSPEFLSELPREIIEEVPRITDEIFEEAQDPAVISDPDIRAWFKAAARTGKSPRDVITESGLLDWMENELGRSLEDIGEIMRGKSRLRAITIDLRPLRRALTHPAVEDYIKAVLAELPPCDAEQLEDWEDAIRYDRDWLEFPACVPDPVLVESALAAWREGSLRDMDDEIEVFSNPRLPRGLRRLGISRLVSMLSYGMFLIPLLILVLAALIAGCSTGGFFRWFGGPVFLGGLSVAALAFLARQAAWWGLDAFYWCPESGVTDLGALALDKTYGLQSMVVGHLFSPVLSLAGIICLIGVLFFGLSFLFPRRATRPSAASGGGAVPAGQTPAAPSQQASPAEPAEAESKPADKKD